MANINLLNNKLDEEREEKIKLLKSKPTRQSNRKMGTIYPKRIQSVLHGEKPIEQFGYDIPNSGYVLTDKLYKHSDNNEYPIYTKDNKEYIKKNNVFIDLKIYDINNSIVPLFCPVCHKKMKGKADEKFFWFREKCSLCVAKDETKYRISGIWKEYENNIILNNQLSYLNDIKVEMEYYINGGLKRTLEYHKEDGTVEKWNNEAYETSIKFIKSELKQIKIYIKKIKKEIKENNIILNKVNNG